MRAISDKRNGEYSMRESTLEDAIYLSTRLRKSDIEEVYASHEMDAGIALKEAFVRSSMCWTGLNGDRPVAMFGCNAPSVMATSASPWMLGTDELDRAAIGIGRASLYYINKMLERYDYLENFIDARQKKSIRWLKWCGFTIEEPFPVGRHGEMFHRFWKEKKLCAHQQ
jgi:hypothetical protein